MHSCVASSRPALGVSGGACLLHVWLMCVMLTAVPCRAHTHPQIRTKDYMDFDQQNPPTETKWWEAYYPSEEEQQAAAEGFDFSNPEKWLADKAAGTLVVNKNEPTVFQAVASFSAAGREWPDMKKEVVVK